MKPFLQKDRMYWAGSNVPEHLELAKQYIKDMGFTREDVKLVVRSDKNRDVGHLYVIGVRTAKTHHDERKH
jgi:hypothetical protein